MPCFTDYAVEDENEGESAEDRFVTPESVRPLPKVVYSERKKGRKKGCSKVLTTTREKNILEEKESLKRKKIARDALRQDREKQKMSRKLVFKKRQKPKAKLDSSDDDSDIDVELEEKKRKEVAAGCSEDELDFLEEYDEDEPLNEPFPQEREASPVLEHLIERTSAISGGEGSSGAYVQAVVFGDEAVFFSKSCHGHCECREIVTSLIATLGLIAFPLRLQVFSFVQRNMPAPVPIEQLLIALDTLIESYDQYKKKRTAGRRPWISKKSFWPEMMSCPKTGIGLR